MSAALFFASPLIQLSYRWWLVCFTPVVRPPHWPEGPVFSIQLVIVRLKINVGMHPWSIVSTQQVTLATTVSDSVG